MFFARVCDFGCWVSAWSYWVYQMLEGTWVVAVLSRSVISDPKSKFQHFWDIFILIRIFESFFSPPLRFCFMQDFGEKFVVRSGLPNQLASTVEPEPPHNCPLRGCGKAWNHTPTPEKFGRFFTQPGCLQLNRHFFGVPKCPLDFGGLSHIEKKGTPNMTRILPNKTYVW